MNRCTILLSFCLVAVLSAAVNAAALGTAFTYQGSLNNAGTPVNELADMRFSLWDASAAGSQIGTTVEFSFEAVAVGPPVNVANGLFTVDLDFGVTPFDGADVFLEIEVRVPSGPAGTWTVLSPRQRIAPAPYALQTRGLYVDPILNVGIGHNGPLFPLDVRTTSGRAIFGWATNTGPGDNYGVFGQSASDEGGGVLGFASANTGTATGVRGVSDSDNGQGVYGLAQSTAISSTNYGVFGEARGLFGSGVFGWATSSSIDADADGVRGQSDTRYGAGLHGVENYPEGPTYGVRGSIASPDGWAAYFTGPSGSQNYFQRSVGIGTLDPNARLHVVGTSDVTATSGGICIVENQSAGRELAFDDNEIQARDGGVPGALVINQGGGDLSLLPNGGGSVGVGTNSPQGTLHVRSASVGVDGADTNNDDLIVEDSRARLGLYSDDVGSSGSEIALAETSAGVFEDQWVISRETTSLADSLIFSFGTDTDHSNNTTIMAMETNGSVFVDQQFETPQLYCGDLDATGTVTADVVQTQYGDVGEFLDVGFTSDPDLDVVLAVEENEFIAGGLAVAGDKAFLIDDPRDPANGYLKHYCHEGPEPQNVYNGIVSLDDAGEATIELPDYFSEINRDPRYFLTAIGAAMPELHVSQTIDPNAPKSVFSVAGGAPGQQVSWEVKAIRNDPYFRQEGIAVEVEKQGSQRGRYLHPELCGQPEDLKISRPNYAAAER